MLNIAELKLINYGIMAIIMLSSQLVLNRNFFAKQTAITLSLHFNHIYAVSSSSQREYCSQKKTQRNKCINCNNIFIIFNIFKFIFYNNFGRKNDVSNFLIVFFCKVEIALGVLFLSPEKKVSLSR